VVLKALPLASTTHAEVNQLPFTASAVVELPATTVAGDIELTLGGGLTVKVRELD
jgi:hypothetical protein